MPLIEQRDGHLVLAESQGTGALASCGHTQGSGKSLSMALYAERVILHPAMENQERFRLDRRKVRRSSRVCRSGGRAWWIRWLISRGS